MVAIVRANMTAFLKSSSGLLFVLAFVGFYRRLEVRVGRLVLGFFLFLKSFALLFLNLLPLLVIRSSRSGVEDRERAVRVTAPALNYEIAVSVANAANVNGVVVATPPSLVPRTIFAAVNVTAIGSDVGAAENDIAHAIGGTSVGAVRAFLRGYARPHRNTDLRTKRTGRSNA